MSATISVQVFDRATPALKAFVARLTPRRLGEMVWPPCLELTRRRLIAYKNKKGFPSQGFGEQLASKTFGTATDTGAQILIHGQGAAQLYYGGTIRPRFKKVLAFGITDESYGKSLPEMFGGEIPPRAQRTPDQNALLKTLRTKFGFAHQVTQPPHPDLLPSKPELAATAKTAIKNAIKGGFKA